MLDLTLNRQSRQPLYKQIAEQIKTQIGDGRLPANTRLPTVRQLAQQVGVTRLTIQNAYNELQADGWVEATIGRGTFVSSAVRPFSLEPTVGQYLTADSALSDMLAINQVIGVRSMAMAHADPTLFPADEFWSHLHRLQNQVSSLLNYGPIQGDTELRVAISQMLQEDGITAVPSDLFITSGAMQGLSLTAATLAQPGDAVLVDQPTYLGLLNILRAQGLRPIQAPYGLDGPDTAVLEQLIRTHNPRFYYTIPNFHNPTGVCLSQEKRQAILALAAQYNLPLLEDDIYGKLGYTPPPPTLKAMDTEDRVIYLSSFSKNLMPGLRVGYLIAPAAYSHRLLALRRATDLCGNDLMQRALAHFLHSGGLKRHLRRVLPIYKERRDALMAALDRAMPPVVQWTEPEGGFSVWLTMPRLFAPGELYRQALRHGLAFTPGDAFLTDLDGQESLRLCFANLTPEGIQAGVTVLASLIQQRLAQSQQVADWIPVV